MQHELPEESQPDSEPGVETTVRRRRSRKAEPASRLRNPDDAPITGYYDFMRIENQEPGMVYELVSRREMPRKIKNGYIVETFGKDCAHHAWLDKSKCKDGEPITVQGELTLLKTTAARKARIDDFDRQAYRAQRAQMLTPQPPILVGV